MASPENPNIPQKGPDKQTDQFELSREASGTTLSRIEKYEDLWTPTEKEGDEKFKELSRQLWKEFATHGFIARDEEGKSKVISQTDLDAKTSIYLHKLAGMDIRDLVYVTPGEIAEGRINTDTGNRHGVITEKTSDKLESYDKTSVDDHHTPESGSDLSATKLVYEKLVSLGLLEREEYLEKAVEFVNLLDNKKFPDQAKYFKHSFATILGLERYLQPKHLFEFFKTGQKPTDILTGDELKKFGLTRAAEKQLEVVNKSLARLKEMEQEGFIVDSERYGKIYVDMGKKLPGGYDAVNYAGGGVYIIWSPETGGFFISTVGKPLQDSFSDGFKVRDTMWMKPKSDGSPLSLTLGEVLNTMTDGKLKPEGALKDYLSQETANVNIKDKVKTMPEKIPQLNPFSSYLEELDRKFADDEISKDEWKERKELIKTADESSDTRGVLEEAFADDKITKKEYMELLGLIPAKEPATTESTPSSPDGSSGSPEASPPPTAPQSSPEASVSEAVDPRIRISEIDTRVAEISGDLSDKVLRWSEAQNLKKERENLWTEKGDLLGHPLEEWEKWSEEQVDRFARAQEDPANRAAISGDLSKEPGPKSKPIGIEKEYWEDIKSKIPKKEETPVEMQPQQNTELTEAQQRIKELEKEVAKLREKVPLASESDIAGETRIRPESGSASQSLAPENKAVGKSFKESVKKFLSREKEVRQASEAEPKTTKATLLSWFKERGKSLLEVPVRGEIKQAEMLRFGTKYSANLAETYSTLLQNEIIVNQNGRLIDSDDAHEIAKEILDEKGKPASEVSVEEFNQAVETAVKKRVETNDDQINRNIGYVIDVIRERLVKSRGQATAEKVLTSEAIKKIEDGLRLKMNELRKGQIVLDTKNLAKFMRDNLDKYWWLRYGYAISEALLARKLISLVVGKIAGIAGAKETAILSDLPDTSDLPDGEGIGPIPPETIQDIYMNPGDNPWSPISENIAKSVGLENPTPQQLMEIDKAFAGQNEISVPEWGIKGVISDRALPAGWYFTEAAVEVAKNFMR